MPPSLAGSSKCGQLCKEPAEEVQSGEAGTRLEMSRQRNTTVLLLYFNCTAVQASGCMQDPELTITALQFLLLGTEQSHSVSLC